MITWMQKHKKYLVITIWISTIAFVGAGFVGWGAYDFNTDRNNAVAKVGEKKITVSEFQNAYSNYFAYYNSIFNNELTVEQAENLGLDKIVLENLINEALLVNFANELGIYPTDEAVARMLADDENFKVDGVFNKEYYYQTLKNARIAPSAYEDGLKKQVVLNRLQEITQLSPNQREITLLNNSLFMQDRVSLEIVRLGHNDISYTDDDLRAFWEPNKSQFLTPPSFTAETIFVSFEDKNPTAEELKAFYDENSFKYKDITNKLKSYEEALEELIVDLKKEQARREALTKYVAFKKDEVKADESKTYFESDAMIDIELLRDTAVGEVIKPTELDNGFVIVKVVAKNPSEPMSFDEAKSMVVDSFLAEQSQTVLTKKSQEALKNFNGTDVGFVTRDHGRRIGELSDAQSVQFVSELLQSSQKEGYIILEDVGVVYKITEQKLASEVNKNYAKLLEDNMRQLKNTEINNSIVENLKKRYKIEYFYKGN